MVLKEGHWLCIRSLYIRMVLKEGQSLCIRSLYIGMVLKEGNWLCIRSLYTNGLERRQLAVLCITDGLERRTSTKKAIKHSRGNPANF